MIKPVKMTHHQLGEYTCNRAQIRQNPKNFQKVQATYKRTSIRLTSGFSVTKPKVKKAGEQYP